MEQETDHQVDAGAVELIRRDNIYVTKDYWFQFERRGKVWILRRYVPGEENWRRIRYFLDQLKRQWPSQVPPGASRLSREVELKSLSEGKQALLSVGYKTMPKWCCRRCGMPLTASRGNWRHVRKSPVVEEHVPDRILSWIYEEEIRSPELGEGVSRVYSLV